MWDEEDQQEAVRRLFASGFRLFISSSSLSLSLLNRLLYFLVVFSIF